MAEPQEHNIQKSSLKATKVLLEVISHHVKSHTNDILAMIAQEYDLDINELQEKYGSKPFAIDLGKVKKKTSTQEADGAQSEPKKRGRKKKPKEELIETEEYEYEGVTYLVDGDNNVYTYNVEKPVYIGTKLIDGRVKFAISSPSSYV